MDLLKLKRDLPSVEDGRWVGKDEVKGLGDARVKVRGHSSKAVRAAFAERERALPEDDLDGGIPTIDARAGIALDVLANAALVDVEGFTADGQPVTLSQVREWLVDPAFAPLAELISAASFAVDASRVSRAEAIRGN